jgi:hypothetical protein
MTPSNALPASAGSNPPRTGKTMPEIIDALRRLERAGSNYSKATEKLLAAAGQLADKIISSYAPAKGEKIEVPGFAVWEEFEVKPGGDPPHGPGCWVTRQATDENGQTYTRYFAIPANQYFPYSIKWLPVDDSQNELYAALCDWNGKPVHKSRTAAFQFADDLVKGLLDLIVKDLNTGESKTHRAAGIFSELDSNLAAKL